MNKIKLLIVDDHQIIIDGLKSLLSTEDFIEIVGEAKNGREAIDLASRIDIDVILMDVDMPIMNGRDATIQIVKNYPTIKIIILTMFNDKSLFSELIKAGASGYVLKNTDKEELIEAIISVSENKTFFSSEIPIMIVKPSTEQILSGSTNNSEDLKVLTDREIQILISIAQGLTNAEISKKLYISIRTVDTHRTNLMRKLSIHNVAGLIKFAIKHNLI
ncbi:MAG: response regulator transcription factor [Bacteroidota bacterium]